MSRRSETVEEKIAVPSKIKYVREISSKILKKLEPLNIDKSVLFDIRLCVEETVRNAIEHGNRNDEKLKIKINYRIEKKRFVFEVEDEGAGFDYKGLPDPTHKNNIMKNNGRGVYLVRYLMDEVEFNDKGNRVRITKYI